MAVKTWQLGEGLKCDAITVETKGNNVLIIGKVLRKTEITRKLVKVTDKISKSEVSLFISNLTTSNQTDKIMEWINNNLK